VYGYRLPTEEEKGRISEANAFVEDAATREEIEREGLLARADRIAGAGSSVQKQKEVELRGVGASRGGRSSPFGKKKRLAAKRGGSPLRETAPLPPREERASAPAAADAAPLATGEADLPAPSLTPPPVDGDDASTEVIAFGGKILEAPATPDSGR
jgi:hypothetical protein